MLAAIFLFFQLTPASPSTTRQTSGNFETIAKKADQARETDHLNDALTLYQEGVRLRPSWANGWWWLGSILYEQDRFTEAQIPLKRFISVTPKPAPAYAFLGLCEYETGDHQHSLQHFEMWAKAGSPGTDALLDVAGYHWALLLTQQGHFNEALFMLAAKAKKLGPSPALTEAMGLASLRMEELPETYPPEKRESIWLAGMAALYLSLNEVNRSDDCASRLLLHYGQVQNVHYFRGTLYSFQKQWESAAQEFQKELQISPNNAAALVELAVAHVEAFQPYEALAPAKRAVVLDPDNARAHYIFGRALLETGSFEDSVHELEIAKRLAPGSARVRFSLSTAYKRLGRVQDSKREEAAFLALKDKEQVLAPLDEKLNTSTQSVQPK
jgi:tetratricopeptide (TPR) repeat protein